MTAYLVAEINTNVPGDGQFDSGLIFETAAGARAALEAEMLEHGRHPVRNAQMMQEAQDGLHWLDQWRGGILHLCGYLTRWDAYPVAGRHEAGPAHERQWRDLRAGELAERGRQERQAAADRSQRYAAARARAARMPLARVVPASHPAFGSVLHWVSSVSSLPVPVAIAKLARLHELRTRPEVAARIDADAYPEWAWETVTAASGDPVAEIETELLAEIAASA